MDNISTVGFCFSPQFLSRHVPDQIALLESKPLIHTKAWRVKLRTE